MELESQVTQYFLFLLDLCRDPADVFPARSAELRLAQAWLEKLCLLVCDNLSERRLRNVYLSHLCSCLYDKELRGPFIANPMPNKLDPNPDFKKIGSATFDCSQVKKAPEKCEMRGKEMERGFINCPQGGKEKREKEKDKSKERQREKKDSEGHKDEEEKVTAYMYEQIFDDPDYMKMFSEDHSFDMKSHKTMVPLRQDISRLLASISLELSGEKEPGTDEHLETEILRYKEFLLKHGRTVTTLIKESTGPQLRSFLLLNLQKDLIKMLSDKESL